MAKRRVVITGVGVINALGITKDEFFSGLLEGKNGIQRITAFDAGNFPCHIGGEAPHPRINDVVPKSHRKSTKLMSRDIELAVIAAEGAVRDARLTTRGTNPDAPSDFDPTRAGTNIGAGLICCDLAELGSAVEVSTTQNTFDHHKWGQEGMQALTPLWLLKYLPNMLGCHVSIIHDLQGPNNNITTGEVSGLLSLAEATRTIQRDRADLMVAGGAECKVNPMAHLRQCLLKRLSTRYNDQPEKAYRPFDVQADGFVVGEGGGILILEELEHARRRQATIYAEVTGFGASCYASDDFINPEPAGKNMGVAMQTACRQAGLNPDQIDLLVAHGLALPRCDAAEATAIRAVFAGHHTRMAVTTIKSRIGNCGAGASAIDAVTAVLAMERDMIPASLNCDQVPKEYGLNIIKTNTPAKIRNAMVTSYTFGGQTAALVLSEFKE